MNDMTSIANPRSSRKRAKSIPLAEPIGAGIAIPAAPQLFPLGQLVRAAENVRHQRIDEDVVGLADDIVAHGLLQSLIGYAMDGKIEIVGGGRRLAALRLVRDRGLIDATFPVPVLIRDIGEAVELSLAENLQQRTMSPVDEFLAFKALMANGTNSPEILAKRFGFTERVVRQRLRLADLAPEILDSLAGREITLDAAMAYATSQDTHLQSEVFKVQSKRSWEPNRAANIRHDLKMKGMNTGHPLFKFVGADIYEREGGGYEDDLFDETGAERQLTHPFIVETQACLMLDFQMVRLQIELQRRDDLSPTIVGFVTPADLRLHPYGTQAKLKAPAGFVPLEKYEHAKMWRTIRHNSIDAHVLVGIDDKGELAFWPRTVFVPIEQKHAIAPPTVQPGTDDQGYAAATPEQRERAARDRGVNLWSRRLAVPPFAGTALEGRAFWPEQWEDRSRPAMHEGTAGCLVSVQIFVTDAEIADARPAAEARYETVLAEAAAADREAEIASAAATKRSEDLLALDPTPDVIVIEGEAWFRDDDGHYASADDDADIYAWRHLIEGLSDEEVATTYATRADFDAAMSAANAAPLIGEDVV
jgi:ParB family chromosome partitioning protein